MIDFGVLRWYSFNEVRKVLTEERYHVILGSLEKEPVVKLQDLVDLTKTSESTIRRDLKKLEESEKLVRIHGGARRIYNVANEDMMEEKSVKNTDEKKRIAKFAVEMIRDGEMIYLDAGSTTYEMIPFLKNKQVTVITNEIPHASLLTDLNIQTIQIGGRIKRHTKAVIGPEAQRQIQTYHFSKAFLGINGVDLEFGYTTPDMEEAVIKQLVMQNANRSFFLADSSKMNKVTFSKVANLEDGNLISSRLSEELKNRIAEQTNIWEVES